MIERRYVQACELRAEPDGGLLVGYASVFDQESVELGSFTEIVKPGAFRKTIQEADVRALWNHDANFVLGRTKSGTLELAEDKRGLLSKITPPDTQWARDLRVSIERGDVNQMSFGFRTIRDRWHQDEGGKSLRELLEVELLDVSPVTFPAYPQTAVEARSVIAALASRNDVPAEIRRRVLGEAIAHLQTALDALRAEPNESDRAGVPLDLLRLQLDGLERL